MKIFILNRIYLFLSANFNTFCWQFHQNIAQSGLYLFKFTFLADLFP